MHTSDFQKQIVTPKAKAAKAKINKWNYKNLKTAQKWKPSMDWKGHVWNKRKDCKSPT